MSKTALRLSVLMLALLAFPRCRSEAPPADRESTAASERAPAPAQPAADIADDRTGVALPVEARAAVIAEMHAMMEALQGMLGNLPARDREGLARAAGGGGVGVAVDRDPAMEAGLPEAFAALGMSTHTAFDQIAGLAREGAPFDTITARMADLMTKCNTCHSRYKLVASEVMSGESP